MKKIYLEKLLMVASKRGKLEMVDFLLKHGSLIDEKNILGETPLISAVENGNA